MTNKEINRVCMEMKYSGKLQRHNQQKDKHLQRRADSDKAKERLISLISSDHGGYNPAMGWLKEGSGGTPYIVYPKNSNAQRFLKKQTAKKARRADLPNKGNAYRKVIDYWWALY